MVSWVAHIYKVNQTHQNGLKRVLPSKKLSQVSICIATVWREYGGWEEYWSKGQWGVKCWYQVLRSYKSRRATRRQCRWNMHSSEYNRWQRRMYLHLLLSVPWSDHPTQRRSLDNVSLWWIECIIHDYLLRMRPKDHLLQENMRHQGQKQLETDIAQCMTLGPQDLCGGSTALTWKITVL